MANDNGLASFDVGSTFRPALPAQKNVETLTKTASPPATFRSILFPSGEDITIADTAKAPEFFRDLNLDQIIEAVTANWAEAADDVGAMPLNGFPTEVCER